jgi:hypothetical protein
MRTTIDIDERLLRHLRDRAHAEGIPFKEMVNRVIERGLKHLRQGKSLPYQCPTFAMGVPLRPIDKALATADELGDEERRGSSLSGSSARRLGESDR